MVPLDARVTLGGDVAHREIGGETVVVNLRTGRYHSLNAVAAAMLSELEAGPTVGAALERLQERYDADPGEVERDLLELCSALKERGLVELAPPVS